MAIAARLVMESTPVSAHLLMEYQQLFFSYFLRTTQNQAMVLFLPLCLISVGEGRRLGEGRDCENPRNFGKLQSDASDSSLQEENQQKEPPESLPFSIAPCSRLESTRHRSDHGEQLPIKEDEELDEFDPYLFIKNLPDLSSVVPTFRPLLLPKQTRICPPISLVLDLDETLVHSTLEPCDDVDFTFPVNVNEEEHIVYVRCCPHLIEFMESISCLFEIIIFTACQSIYAEQLLNVIDPKRKLFRHRVYRDSCVFFDGNYLKDLSVLGRDLSRVIIVNNSPQAFGFQVDNGVPIESWFNDPLHQ